MRTAPREVRQVEVEYKRERGGNEFAKWLVEDKVERAGVVAAAGMAVNS